MRLIYPVALWLVITISLAQAEQSTGTEYNERDACSHATAAAIVAMEQPPKELQCKDSKDPDCDDYVRLEEFYTTEECLCTDRTPGIPNLGLYDKSKKNHDRWVCTVNYYKIPGKW